MTISCPLQGSSNEIEEKEDKCASAECRVDPKRRRTSY